ncbi:hypothetical protein PG990_011324 [Apiospora arundinis]|uniref:Uncharacterized protein n=1 Tax=Apiospora arundinis TaxID=335852 RepID=A0ABR2JI50_9PEZI
MDASARRSMSTPYQPVQPENSIRMRETEAELAACRSIVHGQPSTLDNDYSVLASKLFRLIPITTFSIRPGPGRLAHSIFTQFQGNTNMQIKLHTPYSTLFYLHDVRTYIHAMYSISLAFHLAHILVAGTGKGLTKGLVVEVFCEATLITYATRRKQGQASAVRAIIEALGFLQPTGANRLPAYLGLLKLIFESNGRSALLLTLATCKYGMDRKKLLYLLPLPAYLAGVR